MLIKKDLCLKLEAIWFSCLKKRGEVPWVGAYLWIFFQFQKREINDKGDICVRRDVT